MVKFNVTGDARKALVKKMSDIIGVKAEYQGMPTAAYKIGEYTIGKNGEVDGDMPQYVLDALAEAGFASAIEIEVIMRKVDENTARNFKNMVNSKADLIKKSFGIDDLPMHYEDGVLSVRWFEDGQDMTKVRYAIELVDAMVAKCKTRKFVCSKPVETDNPKFNFRVFLNSIGLAGEEHKALRKELLKNLEGSAAWRHPVLSN